jgi:hypothetical protein
METNALLKIILERFNFLCEKYNFSVVKREMHWLGGVEVEFSNEKYGITILYDKREGCFNNRLYSLKDPNKNHLHILGELRKHCSRIPSAAVSLDDEYGMVSFLTSLSDCLEENYGRIIDDFENGNYYGGQAPVNQ